jgi:hypothetical protein
MTIRGGRSRRDATTDEKDQQVELRAKRSAKYRLERQRLDEHAAPTAAVDFAGQEATSFRLENRTSTPGSPAVGQMWLRTDLI